MARIRSVHPGLYTDDAFMALSMAARMLMIGLWSHADDGGGFEWKPIVLKARIFPADNLDIVDLLSELEENNVVLRYTDDGKTFGAIRNFGKWQRPKKASRFCPMPEHVRKFCHTSDVKTKGDMETGNEPTSFEGDDVPPSDETSSEPVPNQSGISPAEGRKVGREEGRKEEKEEPPLIPPNAENASAEPPPKQPDPRGSRLPDDWSPSQADREFARDRGLSADAVSQKFGDYWRAKPGVHGRKIDWSATWRNWCRTESERGSRGNSGSRREDPAAWMGRELGVGSTQ